MSDRVLIWLLIEQDGAVLLARRKPDARPFAGTWTLPGDLMRGDESAAETIERFSQDQLGATVRADDFIDTFFLEEAGQSYAVTVFKPSSIDGHLRYRESGPYDEVRWATAGELPQPILGEVAAILRGERHWREDEQPDSSSQSA